MWKATAFLLMFASVALTQPAPRVLLTPASAVVPALLSAVRLPPETKPYLLYVSAYNREAEETPLNDLELRWALAHLSNQAPFVPPTLIADRLWLVDLRNYGLNRRDIDNLLAKGSGPAPFPEPYFTNVSILVERSPDRIRELGHYVDAYGQWITIEQAERYPKGALTWVRSSSRVVPGTTKTSFKSSLAPWLPTVETVELQRQTGTQFPIVRLDWFLTYALIEPRYHELIQVNSEKDIDRIVGSDAVVSGQLGSQTRAAVLFSDVAERNRILERHVGRNRARRSWKGKSFDFRSSLAVKDVLFNPLVHDADAHEYLWTNRIGMIQALVTDGNDKRLDKADADIATDKRTSYRDPQVWALRSCTSCHVRGAIRIDDEVRLRSNGLVVSLANQLTGKQASLQKQLFDNYYQDNLNDLILGDQLDYDASVRAVTGRAAASMSLQIEASVNEYLSRPLALNEFSREFGYDPLVIAGAIQRAWLDQRTGRTVLLDDPNQGRALGLVQLSSHLTGTSNIGARPTRRDNFEQQFSRLATVLAGLPQEVK